MRGYSDVLYGANRITISACRSPRSKDARGRTGNVNIVAESVLSEATRRLVEQFHPRRVILFGSQARGTGDDRSDFDFLVICDDVHDRRALMVAMDRCLWGLSIARDILVLTPEEFERDRHIPGTVARPASKEGRVLYDAAA